MSTAFSYIYNWMFPGSMNEKNHGTDTVADVPVMDESWADQTEETDDELKKCMQVDSGEMSKPNDEQKRTNIKTQELLGFSPISSNRKQRRRQKQLDKMNQFTCQGDRRSSNKKLLVGGKMVKT